MATVKEPYAFIQGLIVDFLFGLVKLTWSSQYKSLIALYKDL